MARAHRCGLRSSLNGRRKISATVGSTDAIPGKTRARGPRRRNAACNPLGQRAGKPTNAGHPVPLLECAGGKVSRQLTCSLRER